MLEIDATFLVTFVLVWILVAVLTRVFFNPLRKVMAAREARLKEDRTAAQAGLDGAACGLLELETGLRAARSAAEEAREALEIEALRERESLMTTAGIAAKAEIEKARAALEAEVSRLKDELRAQAGPLAERIEKKLLS